MPSGIDAPAERPGEAAGRTCLVAVDDSEASVHALVWAFGHAAHRGMCVEVLTVWPAHGSPLIHEVPGHFSDARWSARTAQQRALRQAAGEVQDEPVTAARVENADTAAAIVRASARCDLVVLGSNPHDTRHSLTDRVLEEAACDVVVVALSGGVITTNRLTLTDLPPHQAEASLEAWETDGGRTAARPGLTRARAGGA